MPVRRPRVLRCAALRVEQDPTRPLYLFSLTGAQLLDIADISRAERNGHGHLIGYQRPEVKQHIRNIVAYLEGGRVLFPNSIILALQSASWRPLRGGAKGAGSAAGVLEIPYPRPGARKPAWIVDGQQRTLALSKSRTRDLPVPVNAFVAAEAEVQVEQFLRINSAKPLPRGLITELLPSVTTVLPPRLAARRAPSVICDVLNQDPESPFRGLIRRASTPNGHRKAAVVADNALVQAIQDSIRSPLGCLFPHYNLALNEIDMPGVRTVLMTYWTAVRDTFSDAWGLPPGRSRLMHGTGIRAMGRLMDWIMSGFDARDRQALKRVREELCLIKPLCRWTSGTWDELGLRWNEVQNVPSHVRALSNHLVRSYLRETQAYA